MRNEREWPQQCWTEERGKRLQHGCATLRRSRNKRNVRSCWLKSLTGFKLCATACNRVCKRTQHVTSNNVGNCWSTMLRPFARRLIEDQLHYRISTAECHSGTVNAYIKWRRIHQPLFKIYRPRMALKFTRRHVSLIV